MSTFFLKLSLIFLCFSYLRSQNSWIPFQNVQTHQCPNPNNLTSKEFLINNGVLPQTLENGPYNQWCIKRNCEKPPNYSTSFGPASLSVRTPYAKMAGFRVQMAWDFQKRAQYVFNESSQWCFYYNQDDCYYGGTEFGLCSVYNFKNFVFYATPPFENIYNPPFQYWNRTDNTFYDIPEPCRAYNRVQVKFNTTGIIPIEGINYLNFTAIATDQGYLVSISVSNANTRGIRTLAENQLINYPICNYDIRNYFGRITASIGTNFNRYGLRDSITYQKIEYLSV